MTQSNTTAETRNPDPRAQGAYVAHALSTSRVLGPHVREDLIPILPADARPAPDANASKILSCRGKAPGVMERGGWHLAKDWRNQTYDPSSWLPWPGVNCGVRLGPRSRLAFVDIDIVDPELSRVVLSELLKHLAGSPDAPVPIRRGALLGASRPKCGFFVLLDAATAGSLKKATTGGVRRDGTDLGKVELLADGQQVVAGGAHASGGTYLWTDGPNAPEGSSVPDGLFEASSSLPGPFSADALRDLFRALKSWLLDFPGMEPAHAPGGAGGSRGPMDVDVDMLSDLRRTDFADPSSRRGWLDAWMVPGQLHDASVVFLAEAARRGLSRDEALSETFTYRDDAGRMDAEAAWDGAAAKLATGEMQAGIPISDTRPGDAPALPSWMPDPTAPRVSSVASPANLPAVSSPGLTMSLDDVPEGGVPPTPHLLISTRDPVHGRILPRRTIGMLSGRGGAGKSTLALSLAVHSALGRPFFGDFVPARPLRTLAYLSEDPSDVTLGRLALLAHSAGAPRGSLEANEIARNVKFISERSADPFLLRSMQVREYLPDGSQATSLRVHRTTLLDEIEMELASAQEKGEPYDLLVVDPLGKMHDGDENSRAFVSAATAILGALAVRRDIHLLMIAHPPKGGGNDKSEDAYFSGSSAWEGGIRSGLSLYKMDDDPRTRHFAVEVKKNQYAPRPEPFEVWRSSTGVYTSSVPVDLQKKKAVEAVDTAVQKARTMREDLHGAACWLLEQWRDGKVPRMVEGSNGASYQLAEMLRSPDYAGGYGSPPEAKSVRAASREIRARLEALPGLRPQPARLLPDKEIDPVIRNLRLPPGATSWARASAILPETGLPADRLLSMIDDDHVADYARRLGMAVPQPPAQKPVATIQPDW